jgi:hypothetical protein
VYFFLRRQFGKGDDADRGLVRTHVGGVHDAVS